MFLIAHGGVGSPRDYDENVAIAIKKGFSEDMNAFEAVVEVVAAMEDDPTFNAGKGSRMRLDGSIQMDAAVHYQGDIGAVAAIEEVKNPIKIAAEVHESPYVMLAGKDATNFARKLGYEEVNLSTEKRKKELKEMKEKLRGSDGNRRLKKMREFYKKIESGDTVGCVAYIENEFAAAVSTGGTNYCMRGRVGDSPLVGCGFYTGDYGAVVTTGKGEEIIKKMVAKRCYDLIPDHGLKEACDIVVEEFPDDYSVGVIAVDENGTASSDNRDMAQAELSL